MKTTIQSLKGMRDFYPEDKAVHSWLYKMIREVSESFGYQEWDGPMLEKIDLYAAKSGEELVKEQSFVFPDRGGDLIALRPELTPSLARLVAQRQQELVFPLRWWSFGPFWRYEKPQRGRTREFYQWNIDLVGPDTPESDAELVAIAAVFLKKVGFTPDQVMLHVNDRRLMDMVLVDLGIPAEARVDVFRLIDRQDKMPADAWADYAAETGLRSEQITGLRTAMNDSNLWQRLPELQRFYNALDALGAREYVRFDPKIIRGLDYYTGTVFEAKEQGRSGRSVLGGGRYDNLVEDVGGSPVAAVGFAMGDVMATILVQEYGLAPAHLDVSAAALVTVFDEDSLLDSFALAAEIRAAGIKVAVYPEAIRLPRQLKYADRIGVRYALIEGADEKAAGVVTVKDLRERTQESVARADLAAYLRR